MGTTMIPSFNAETATSTIADAIRLDGVAVIQQAIDPAKIIALAEHFNRFYAPRLLSDSYPYHHVKLSKNRYHNTLEIHLAFNDPAIYANETFMRVATELLGKPFVLGSLGVATAYPGATSQHLHRDHTIMFDDPHLNAQIPPVQLVLGIPLVAVGGDVGGTAFVRGSQYTTKMDDVSLDMEEAKMSIGDIAVWDARTYHRGAPNHGHIARPLLLYYYQRPWFFDYQNGNRKAITPISRANYARVPHELRFLFDPLIKFFGYTEFMANRNDPCPCGSSLRFKHCHGSE